MSSGAIFNTPTAASPPTPAAAAVGAAATVPNAAPAASAVPGVPAYALQQQRPQQQQQKLGRRKGRCLVGTGDKENACDDGVIKSLMRAQRAEDDARNEEAAGAGSGAGAAAEPTAAAGSWTAEDVQLMSEARRVVKASTPDYWEEVAAYVATRGGRKFTAAQCQQLAYVQLDGAKSKLDGVQRDRKRRADVHPGGAVHRLAGRGTQKSVRQRRQYLEDVTTASDDDDLFESQDLARSVIVQTLLAVTAGAGSDNDAGATTLAADRIPGVRMVTATYPGPVGSFAIHLTDVVDAGRHVLFVDDVDPSAAAAGVVQRDDVLCKVDDAPVFGLSVDQLMDVLDEHKASGNAVRLQFCRVPGADAAALHADGALTASAVAGAGASAAAADDTQPSAHNVGSVLDAVKTPAGKTHAVRAALMTRPSPDAAVAGFCEVRVCVRVCVCAYVCLRVSVSPCRCVRVLFGCVLLSLASSVHGVCVGRPWMPP